MATANINTGVNSFIASSLSARNDKSAWSKAVTAYALELVETLDNWDKQPESVGELREMLLSGAADWNAYRWGGSSLIYNQDIAERVCTPSELKRVTNKNGLRDMANARERWLDVQAPAPCIRPQTSFAKSPTTTSTHETQSISRPGGGGVHCRRGRDMASRRRPAVGSVLRRNPRIKSPTD